MILFPAIDLKDGACVRLVRGEMSQSTTFNDDPAAQACDFADAGFEWIHIVDLNGAFAGKPVNAEAVAAIAAAVDLPVQLGGGIRSMDTIARWLEAGVQRVILGTAALKDPDLVRRACDQYPGRIVVGIDAREGRVAVEGWAETSEMKVLDLAMRFENDGVAAIVYTDIDRDGAMQGVNVDATVDLAFALTTPVIASGGVRGISDLADLKENESAGIEGVISGRAIYDGRLDAGEALELLRN
ncbi:MAG: 1-(5-phosphoribosyl)-5-[(5-phosphoribosylamino)methylideneamino]imidazole-4-carboxamide isomerase [Rhodospirillaceae bacterium]|nr:1-(5-phosphoribosyl)-5-[(5-phosphoribosylamino)methylideneamino]imidazole-4-carboxamide isomerase [Rhodospirillaceae bacterium]RPF98296.1 MAG: 1-(5-phosphoribosyl)-5-[(5-phosphoribosylamino)methylideneamino]imidazole-4-carboxamide isomerase [Rhodospirillaceae bacterium TMED63]RZO37524.1 MAG: 1-(5-phosphoribosyl)-5-[(5-phosphoribosylamino)methylideneamino]imidazole-4-carboxamide isomerase [Rhodospirillaceae bacterium]